MLSLASTVQLTAGMEGGEILNAVFKSRDLLTLQTKT